MFNKQKYSTSGGISQIYVSFLKQILYLKISETISDKDTKLNYMNDRHLIEKPPKAPVFNRFFRVSKEMFLF